mmetsp:Transcript_5920/g.16594  ORF Transcript_5920/g.16594 Transcript_5920/m.16594 type:complete len:301 (-) Transcript_5920:681-1583(-)
MWRFLNVNSFHVSKCVEIRRSRVVLGCHDYLRLLKLVLRLWLLLRGKMLLLLLRGKMLLRLGKVNLHLLLLLLCWRLLQGVAHCSDRSGSNGLGAWMIVIFVLRVILHTLFLKTGCNPSESNSIQLSLSFISQLRFQSSQFERVFVALFHHPSPKVFIWLVVLRHVAVSIGRLVLAKLLETIVPARDWRSNLPLESNRFQQSLSFFGHGARLARFSQRSSIFLVSHCLAVSLLLHPSAQLAFLRRNIAMTILRLVGCQLFKILIPLLLGVFFECVPYHSQMIQDFHALLRQITGALGLSF